RPSRLPRTAQARREEEEAHRVEEEAEREWRGLSPEARIHRALQVAHLLLRSRASVGEMEDLARLMRQGVLDPKTLIEELKEASSRGTLEEWLQ
ncbi:hypothetical protein L6232_23130, partial [Shewanella sp. C31]|nr:hypothetical protein [Shewanella electrica]